MRCLPTFDVMSSGQCDAVSVLLPRNQTVILYFTALVYVFAMFTSNESLKYVTYPTQTLAKSW